MKSKSIFLLQLAVGLMLTVTTQAQWATDAAVNNGVSSATEAQRYVQSASDGAGGVILVWEDYRSGVADIYAQRINISGIVQWTTNGVAISTATGQQESPVIVSDGSGGAIIAWQDLRSGNLDIYAQRVNASGVVQWPANGVVISATTLNQENPQITIAPSGGAVVVWEDNRSGGSGTDYDIYAQRVDANGVIQWATNGVALCTALGSQALPVVAALGFTQTGVVVSWQDQRTVGDQNIYAQAINNNGVVLWAADGVAVCSATGSQFNPSIVYDGNSSSNGAIITWEDYREGTTNANVYAQRFNVSGVAQWTADGVVISSATGNQTKPRLVRVGTGEALITWEDARNGNADIFAQRVNGTGIVQWTANGVGVCLATGNQTNPQLVSNAGGGDYIVWEDNRGASMDVYAQKLNTTGAAQWTTNGIAIASATNEQSSPTIISDFISDLDKRGVIIAWDDLRSGTYDIYAQRVNASGLLCGNVPNPGAITGNQTILAGSSNSYTVNAVTSATAYTWTLPTGWTGTSATNSINTTANGTSGNISVSTSNACGSNVNSSSLAITVNKQNQTITFAALSQKAVGNESFDLIATSTSGLSISYTSSNTAVATITGSAVTIVGVGTTSITASQAGNEIFNVATDVVQDLVVVKGDQTITFAALSAKTLGDAPFTLSATASSGLAIAYTSSNSSVATVSGNMVSLVAAGSVTIHADQAGNANYNAAARVSQTFCVNPAKPTLSPNGLNTETPTLTSSSSTGNQWYLNDAAIAGATNATVSVAAPGVYKVQVTVGGCSSVFSDSFGFVITADNTNQESSGVGVFPNPVEDKLIVQLSANNLLKTVSVYSLEGIKMESKQTHGNQLEFEVTKYPPSLYLVKISTVEGNKTERFIKQ